MSTAGNKIEDDKQEYSLSQMGPSYISPSGHELSFYDTEENERLVVKHSSGSHIEFKADGSVFIKAIKDMQLHAQSLSDQTGALSGSVRGSDKSNFRFDTDLNLEVGGRLTIKCKQFDLEVDDTTYIKSGTDYKVEANNIMEKATEQGSYEASKSLYFDSKEKRERFTTSRTEIGSEESSGGMAQGDGFTPLGGVNVITIIENNNPSGGITISSAGYLNLVCGGERVDITGKWGAMGSNAPVFKPGVLAKPFQSTFTNLVFDPMKGVPDPKMQYNAPPGTGGSYSMQTESSAVYYYATTGPKAPLAVGNGLLQHVMTGNMTQNVAVGSRFRNVLGNELVKITGTQQIFASLIFLN